MTSTRSNPRIGQSPSSLTSLGAVGGPRGTAAGALRVIVEFLTQYDPKAIQALESDLAGLSQLEEQLGNKQISLSDRISKQRLKIAQAEATQAAVFQDRGAKSALRQSEKLRAVAALGGPGSVQASREAAQQLNLAIKRQGLTAAEERTVRALVGGRTRLRTLEAEALKIAQDRAAVDEQGNAVQGQLSQFQQLKGNLPSKLAGLAIGAVGGLVGGALIGVGFQAAQAVLDKIAQGLADLIDPAAHARDAIAEVGKEINSLASGQNLSREAAAKLFLDTLGITADSNTIKVLAEASAQEKLTGSLATQNQVLEIKKHADAAEKENIKQKINILVEEDKMRGTVHEKTIITAKGVYQVIDAAYYEAEAIRQNTAELNAMDAETQRVIESQARLAAQLQATASLAAIAAKFLSDSIQSGADALGAPIDAKINALQDSGGESARTRAIQAKIDALQNKPSGAKNTELANIAEERALILLRQRLRLLGTNIDLEKFSGKFLLEAINAKIKALDKQAAAEALVNRELDLQMRMSQQLKRQQGESISDFLTRRAKENRDQLTEQRAIDQDRAKSALQDLQDRVQDEVALQNLAERKKNALAKAGSDNRIKELQKELTASKKADADALKAKIEALKKQQAALKTAAANADYYASATANAEIQQAIRAANSVEKIAQLSGASRGLFAAKSFLTALLQSGVLKGDEAKQVSAAIDRINGTLAKLGDQQYSVASKSLNKGGHLVPFAKGGFIPLNGGSTPFGQNAKFGEEGTEAGLLVLTNQMMQKMKGAGSGWEGDVYIYRSEDPARDFYRTEKAVEAGMRKALS